MGFEREEKAGKALRRLHNLPVGGGDFGVHGGGGGAAIFGRDGAFADAHNLLVRVLDGGNCGAGNDKNQ